MKSNSNCSDPASDSSQLDEDVFFKNDEVPTIPTRSYPPYPPPPHPLAGVSATHNLRENMPPPPPYSVAVSRLAQNENQSFSSTAGIRFQQQQIPDMDDINGRAGIFPAARARLASLKSLGSKKLNAIKMRLSDNRQKLEECK